jgi:hypothetical protein
VFRNIVSLSEKDGIEYYNFADKGSPGSRQIAERYSEANKRGDMPRED